MGYNIHITRCDQWSESSGNPIVPEELLNLGITFLDGVAAVNPQTNEKIEITGISSFYWPPQPDGKSERLYFMDGRIVFKYRDDEQINVATSLAAQLNAKVIGDEGEIIFYPPVKPSDHYYEVTNADTPEPMLPTGISRTSNKVESSLRLLLRYVEKPWVFILIVVLVFLISRLFID